jgi:hypothetical protein
MEIDESAWEFSSLVKCAAPGQALAVFRHLHTVFVHSREIVSSFTTWSLRERSPIAIEGATTVNSRAD